MLFSSYPVSKTQCNQHSVSLPYIEAMDVRISSPDQGPLVVFVLFSVFSTRFLLPCFEKHKTISTAFLFVCNPHGLQKVVLPWRTAQVLSCWVLKSLHTHRLVHLDYPLSPLSLLLLNRRNIYPFSLLLSNFFVFDNEKDNEKKEETDLESSSYWFVFLVFVAAGVRLDTHQQ